MCYATKITTYDHAGQAGFGGTFRDWPEAAEHCPVCGAERASRLYPGYECGGGYMSEWVSTQYLGGEYYSHDFFFCPFEKTGRTKKLAPLFTYTEFLNWNTRYFRQADHRDYYIALRQALALVKQHDATSGPATGSRVIASGWNSYNEQPALYKNAQLEVDSDGDISICTQPMIPSTGILDNGRAYLSTSGGYFVGAKAEDLVRLSEKQPKTFWCWGSSGAGANHGIYFTIPVPVWVYHNEAKIY